MSEKRTDTWSKEEDQLLVDTVLRFIQEGKTQVEAFEEVGEKVERTPVACGYRWNSVLRKNYTKEIKVAKKMAQKPQKKVAEKKEEQTAEEKKVYEFEGVLAYLREVYQTSQSLESHQENTDEYKERIQALENQLTQSQERQAGLEIELESLRKENEQLHAIVGNVRSMVVANS